MIILMDLRDREKVVKALLDAKISFTSDNFVENTSNTCYYSSLSNSEFTKLFRQLESEGYNPSNIIKY